MVQDLGSITEIVKISQGNSLAKVTSIISLTNKVLIKINKKEIVLYNESGHYLQRKIELAFLTFIKKNIWLFLPEIIIQIKNGNLSYEPYPLDFIMNIDKHDLNYEYPRSFYRIRGDGKTLVCSEYDRQLKEKNGLYTLCSPPMDKEFESMAFQNITCFIAGKILTEYADTSIGLVLGLKCA